MYTRKKIQTTTRLALALALLLPAGLIRAATPPELVNFEGVLRGATGIPAAGTVDMVFYFYDTGGGASCPAAGGTLLLTDSHAGMGNVTITGGLFNVELGGGVITAGSDSSLSEVFRDNTGVYVEVQVNTELLCPRIHMTSAGYSLNADNLDGVDSSGYINTSAAAQTKAGDLTVNDLTVSGNDISFGNGAVFSDLGTSYWLRNNTDLEDMFLYAGNSEDDGALSVFGNSTFNLISGNGLFQFKNGAAGSPSPVIAELDASGDLQIDGNLTVGGDALPSNYILLDASAAPGLGPYIRGHNTGVDIVAGDSASDTLVLQAGNGTDNGSILIGGDNIMTFRAGSGNFFFSNAITSLVTASLDTSGKLRISGQEIWINQGGPEESQEIEFFNNGVSANERMQWDDPADRFEFSDDLHVFGTLTANVKAFVQNHPYRPDLEVVYVSLEGDESTTFTRGFGRLRDGVARVALGESFAFVTNPDIGVSAHVTPRGTWADLYVESVTPEELVVRSRDGENPDGVFDYIVFGLRIGFEEFPVFRQKRAEAFIPPQGYYEEEYQRDPALRDYNALERYGRMAARVHGTRTLDLEASRRLREAIGEHDPTFDFPPGSTVSVAEMNQMQDRDEQVGLTLDEREIDRLVDRPEPLEVETAVAATTAPPSRVFRDEQGNSSYASSFRPTATDMASLAHVIEPVEAGDVLIIDPEQPGMMSLAREAGDTAVFGVVAETPDAERTVEESGPVEVPVAVSGVVFAKVDAGYGSIRPGDLLTTSPTLGHAMRADAPQIGTVLGKALEPLDVGTGLIKVLVMLR